MIPNSAAFLNLQLPNPGIATTASGSKRLPSMNETAVTDGGC